ncbi:MAG TPA: thioredoxin domain-containing protein [Bryobacteraceae bacterium]|nr:thioredoxin domain-containing protein [Bryobacteraceae bacterium]
MANHLIDEKSPYLQQHAHNPVDWYPWGDAAFEKARQEDKPIFLSIGYSTCHWCHVMERESFESEAIAELINRSFVPVKVDREERPDVDRIYMTYVQAATGSGGWPMSVFLTPDLKPFFGGTYFPPDNRYGRPGFPTLLQRIASAWREQRAEIVETSGNVISQLKKNSDSGPTGGIADKNTLDSTFQYFRRTFDSTHGGFGDAPKFPRPVIFNFLLRYYARTQRNEALQMSLDTLRAMAAGGMHDQLGGGFHRYSVDERWLVPHFEKMLYDQAQLAISYLEAYQITRNTAYSDIARSTLDYVLRDMTHPDGGFYSAEDADSIIDPANQKEKGEGAFYIWTAAELEQILGRELHDLFAAYYGVEKDGNVHQDPHGEFTGKNILYLREPPEPAVARRLKEARTKLLEVRSKRVRPHLDDKILTSWNALMISAFAKAAQILDEPHYLAAAQRAMSFILTRMYDRATGILQRRFREGEAAINGFLDDYAFLIAALLDLYEADFDPRHLETAIALAAKMRELFEDPDQGAFFTTAGEDSSLVLRMKDDYDGAEPSGNSVALLDLLRLAHFTDRDEYRQAAARTLDSLMPKMSAQPVAVPQMLVALDYSLAPKREVVIAGDSTAEPTHALLRELRGRFLPYTVSLLVDSDATREKLTRIFPAAGVMRAVDGQSTAYVCQNYSCSLPTTKVSKFAELLQ